MCQREKVKVDIRLLGDGKRKVSYEYYEVPRVGDLVVDLEGGPVYAGEGWFSEGTYRVVSVTWRQYNPPIVEVEGPLR